MKILPFLTLIFFLSIDVIGQELKIDFSYHYLFANQWDKTIQTYNFSRPNLSEKQGLLLNGSGVSTTFLFKSPKKVKQGINFSYSYFRSLAENQNYSNLFNLNFISVAYVVHFNNTKKSNGFYSDIIFATKGSALFRRINENPFVYNEKKSKAFGLGGEISTKLGYCIRLRNNYFFSPFISLGYSPYFFSPKTEEVINGTKSLTSKKWTGILNAQVGLSFHLIQEKN